MITSLTGKDPGGYNTAFFDFDGTILESGEGVLNALRYMFSRIGMEEPDEKRLLEFIGPPIKIHLLNAHGMSERQATEAYAYFREYYLDKGILESRPYDGVADALIRIKRSGKTLYIATCKTEALVRPVIAELGLAELFDDVFGACHERGIWDKTQVLQNALEQLGGRPARAVMVGDRNHDVIGGVAVGLDTAGVLYGYGGRDELTRAGCDFLLDSAADLRAMLGGAE